MWAAPGRVNLIGEHTDYNDGFVLPFALDRRVLAAAAPRDDGVLRAVSLQHANEAAVSVALDEVGDRSPKNWTAYVAGPLWALRGAGVDVTGVDIVLDSTVPVGSGLSSSAAMECAVITAASELFGGPDDPVELARLAQRAENVVVGAPVGIMDQVASLAATAHHALFLDTRSLGIEHIPLALADNGLTILVVDTQATHSHATGQYAERRRSCEEAAELLQVAALRDATPAQVEKNRHRLGEPNYRRAKHVVTENARVLAVVEQLRRGRPELIGAALDASHMSMRDDFEASSEEQDEAVAVAMAAGAIGARMTGGGFGGCAIALMEAGRAADIAAAVVDAFIAREWQEPVVFAGIPSDGARRIA